MTKIVKINPDFPDNSSIKEAAEVLQKGGLVAFPTETVYGIGANFLDKIAIARLYKIKKRPKHKPFTIHISKLETLKDLNIDLSQPAKKIIDRFWPGPLTIVAFNNKRERIGLRMPASKVAQLLIDEASIPIVAPSANISGKRPPTTGEEVVSQMKGLLDMILDAGPTQVGIESTIVDVTAKPLKILREGAISKKELLADARVLFVCTGNSCRSVMAKAMLEKFLKQAGLFEKVYVDSAGTSSYTAPAAENAIEVMKEKGIDVSMHKGKKVSPQLLKRADFIFVMGQSHKDIILNMVPEAGPKLRLLKEKQDIPDPIGKDLQEYRRIRDIIKDEVENIFLGFFKKERGK